MLGHLHVPLDDSHLAAIVAGSNIVMVPIDGTYTMSLDEYPKSPGGWRASVVLPMHRFATLLEEFMAGSASKSEIDVRQRTHFANLRGIRCRARRR